MGDATYLSNRDYSRPSRDEVCSFENLYKSMKICRRGVGWKDSVIGWTRNGAENCLKLKESLENGKYKISKYSEFTIYEPKKRDIVSTRFKDRVFQRSMCDNYFYEAMTKHFIYDNCACQQNKGTDFALNRLDTHLHRYFRKHGSAGYVLKMDIKDYFGSTLHSVAKQAVTKRCKDPWITQKVFDIIDSFGAEKGMGLGSQVTQLIQLAVLDDLDHFIKEKLCVKHYVRYMDDMIIIGESKERLKEILNTCSAELAKISLKLNTKKTQIFPIKQGIDFLGFKHKLTDTGKVLRIVLKKNVKTRRRKIRSQARRVKNGEMPFETLDESFQSWTSHVARGNNYKVLEGVRKYYNQVKEEIRNDLHL